MNLLNHIISISLKLSFFKTKKFRIGESVAQIIRISEPIKKHFAKRMDISVDELLGMSMI